jgi:hypothetical protein
VMADVIEVVAGRAARAMVPTQFRHQLLRLFEAKAPVVAVVKDVVIAVANGLHGVEMTGPAQCKRRVLIGQKGDLKNVKCADVSFIARLQPKIRASRFRKAPHLHPGKNARHALKVHVAPDLRHGRPGKAENNPQTKSFGKNATVPGGLARPLNALDHDTARIRNCLVGTVLFYPSDGPR